MSNEELLKAGNTFARGLLLAFAAVYALYITADHPIDEKAVQSIGEHRKELLTELSEAEAGTAGYRLGSQLMPSDAGDRLANLQLRSDSHRAIAMNPTAKPKNVIPTYPPPSIETVRAKINDLREKVIRTYLDEAAAQKAADVQYAVPGLPGSFSEKTVVLVFPLAVFVATLRIVFYRRALLRHLDEIEAGDLPIWLAPIPAAFKRVPFSRWVLVNTAGLTIIVLMNVLLLEYIADTRVRLTQPVYQSFAEISTLFGYFCLATYAVLTIRAIWGRR
jgi:hypothetical protein